MFAPKEPPARPPPPPKRETVVLEPSYNLQAGLLAISGGVAWAHELPNWIYWGTPLAAFTGLLGLFLTIQAQRIRWARVVLGLCRPMWAWDQGWEHATSSDGGRGTGRPGRTARPPLPTRHCQTWG